MSDTYCYLHLRGGGRDSHALRTTLQDRILSAWRQSGITVWGVWEGMFGVGSNELLVVAAASGQRAGEDFTAALDAETGVLIREVLMFTPTVRPEGTAPCEQPGLYVFRFFDVADADVAEVAALSAQAWKTFEHTDNYAAEPQGLFRQRDVNDGPGRMLLVTWYDGLDSWQTSRQPAADAVENFRRRRELTNGTMALATRLLVPFPA